MHTHLEQWAADTAAPGEQLGVQCLAQGSHLSRGQFQPEPRFKHPQLRITSPTLSPLGHDCLSLSYSVSQSVSGSDDGSAPGDDVCSPDRQRRPGHIPSEDLDLKCYKT